MYVPLIFKCPLFPGSPRIILENRMLCTCISSVESQKGINDAQRSSVENQKGDIACLSQI